MTYVSISATFFSHKSLESIIKISYCCACVTFKSIAFSSAKIVKQTIKQAEKRENTDELFVLLHDIINEENSQNLNIPNGEKNV